MSIRNQPGVTARDLIKILVVGETPNERGEEYASVPAQVGEPVSVVSKPLTGRERFEQGKTESSVAYVLYVDLRGSENITPKVKLWHPKESSRNEDGEPDFTRDLLDVSSVQRYEFGENVAVISAERTY